MLGPATTASGSVPAVSASASMFLHMKHLKLDGKMRVMQAYSLILDSGLTYEGLQTLDRKLKLAPAWKYRVKVLDQDLTIRAVNGHARIVQDDLENTYDACFETACTYKP